MARVNLTNIPRLEGNQKACVFLEPLWAIPYNLFLPFASIYMAAIGLQDKQIGMVASLGLAMQLVWGLFSGAIVNKYGRRRMILIFGLLSWTVPCLLWATAKGYPFFILAVFFNSMQQVVNNSFSCLIVEDGHSEKLVNIWAILNLVGDYFQGLSRLWLVFVLTGLHWCRRCVWSISSPWGLCQ